MSTKIAIFASKLVLFCALLSPAGCSTSFNREYKSALSQPIPDTIDGPWEGRWLSDKNGHTGKLRAVLTKTTPNEYDAWFHATYWKIFRASYRVPLKVEGTTLSGEADLGWLSGGRYTYEGEVTPTSFFSTYKMKYDHGTFEMKRPLVTPNAPPPQTSPPK